jgi:nucleoid-associated protein YgaU
MSNDAKLGLVVGVCLVIAVAVAFFRKDLVMDHPPEGGEEVAAASRRPPAPPPGSEPRAQIREAPREAPAAVTSHKGQNHTVKHGESLFSLAQQYYGDGHKYTEIYRVNRRLVSNPDYVAPGTVLFIPDLN